MKITFSMSIIIHYLKNLAFKMNDLVLHIIKLEIESIKFKKLLIEKYSGLDDPISQIITKDARASIKQSQESIQVFSQLNKI